MDLTQFRSSLAGSEPPSGLSPPLLTLWWEAKGDWRRAHECAQEDRASTGSIVHAYLHRVEGDLSNAGNDYLMRQVSCIGGGTTEMARNVISERVLGMPRERSMDRDVPFRDVPRGGSSPA